MTDNQSYTCNEYRQEMILLALQRKLASSDLTEAEKHRLQREIQVVKTQMGMQD